MPITLNNLKEINMTYKPYPYICGDDYINTFDYNRGYEFNLTPSYDKDAFKTIDRILDKLITPKVPDIKRIIFNDPATIIFWADGTKTVVKATEGDEFNPYYGFCCAVTKKMFGNNSKIKKILKKYGQENMI